MDLSALIFVALAVAWGAYLIPKALKHAEDVDRTTSIDRFSASLRVLARREPVPDDHGRLVTRPDAPSTESRVVIPTSRLSRTQLQARREAAALAAKRRMRVFSILIVANLVVGGLAVYQVIAWPFVALPVALTIAWLVACRLMVKSERRTVLVTSRLPVEVPPETDETGTTGDPITEEILAVQAGQAPSAETVEAVEIAEAEAEQREFGSWDPMPEQLPTYVSKSQAPRRTVRTIDLESTGVWTSGNTDSASKLARQAEATERSEKAEQAKRAAAAERRASGS